MHSRSLLRLLASAGALAIALNSALAQAQTPAGPADKPSAGVAAVEVRDAWVRAAVPGQSGTGAFMKLTAPAGARLVGVSSPVAGVAQIHEMKMEGDTMRMRAVQGGLALAPQKTLELSPGGLHLMLMDLKQPVRAGDRLPLTLRFEDAQGRPMSLQLDVPVQQAAERAGGAAAHGHKH